MKVVNKPIKMIAWFTNTGVVQPIKFRFKDEKGSYKVIKIDNLVEQTKETKYGIAMILFKCQSFIDGVEKLYELIYEVSSCRWYVYKF